MSARGFAPVFFLLVASSLYLMGQGNAGTGNLTVRVLLSNGRPAHEQLLVQLMAGASTQSVEQIYTNDWGTVEFRGIPPGTYHVVVTGPGIQKADSGVFEVDFRRATQSQFVTVHRIEQTNSSPATSTAPTVAAVDLNIPVAAQKQFDKAEEAMVQHDWKKALALLNKAISIEPRYASAYNNLGVVYAQMQDIARAHEALEKAVSLNGHFAAAYVNLARLSLREQQSAEAEALLEKAITAEPTNAQALMLLANAQLLNHHYDAAIATAHKVHAMPHERMALVHYVAARALEHENRPQEAVAELQTFLHEEPDGPRAAQARAEILRITKQVRP